MDRPHCRSLESCKSTTIKAQPHAHMCNGSVRVKVVMVCAYPRKRPSYILGLEARQSGHRDRGCIHVVFFFPFYTDRG